MNRWVSTVCAARDAVEIDSQADCVGSQYERLSNKLEPSVSLVAMSTLRQWVGR